MLGGATVGTGITLNNNTVSNLGTVSVGDSTTAATAGDNNTIVTRGSITPGLSGIGIEVNNGGRVSNSGTISVGDGGSGILANGNNVTISNSGTGTGTGIEDGSGTTVVNNGTLNHLLATDYIWMKRFTGAGEAPDRLVHGLDEARLKGVIRYRRVSTPEEFVQPLMPALDHWFNHQTHHRGHAHMILTTIGRPAPELDLLFYQREAEAGRA